MSRPFSIRRGTLEDIEQVVGLAVELVVESRSHLRPEVTNADIQSARFKNFEQLEGVMEHPECGLFIALDERGKMIGHILLLGNNVDAVADIKQAWIYDVSVRRHWWGQGVGRALMAAGEQFARELGLGWIGLGVTLGNKRAVDFYEELGYQRERVQMIKRLEASSDSSSRW